MYVAKCKWDASQQCTWLGFNIDLSLGVVSVPKEKIVALQAQVLPRNQLPAKCLASLTGKVKVISMSMALDLVARLMYALINTRQAWCEVLNGPSRTPVWHTEIQISMAKAYG